MAKQFITKTLRQQLIATRNLENLSSKELIKARRLFEYSHEADKYKHIDQMGMPHREHDQVLLVGRTREDVNQCKNWAKWNQARLQQQGFATSTSRVSGYKNFPGDIITSHTVKYGARIAVTCEVKEREVISAQRHPGKVWVFPDLVKVGTTPWGLPGIRVLTPGGCNPVLLKDTGCVMLWAAWQMGYKKVYTIGLDFKSRPSIYPWVAKLVHLFILPDGVELYKADEVSMLNVPIEFPPGLKKGRSK